MNGFDELPAWATRFHFHAHSASAIARPDSKEFFEKVIARPQELYDRAGCPALAGRLAEKFAKDVVIKNADRSESFRHALSMFDTHNPLDHVAGDADKFFVIRDAVYTVPKTDPKIEGSVFELTLNHTAEGLAAATQGQNQITDGRWVSVHLEGVTLPFIGQIDVEDAGVVEIKTRYPSISARTKRGWQINSLPSKPMPDHVAQVAIYWKWLKQQADNVPVKLVYANCRGYRIFTDQDTEQLSPANLCAALDRMRTVARTREKLMQKAQNINDLFELVAPDFSHFMWRNVPPEYRAAAEQIWSST